MPHRITRNDAWFLAMNRIDPLLKEPFKEGDEVVVCASCKSVQLADIWDMGNQCVVCNHKTQAETFNRSFIDFSYGKSLPSCLRWIRSPVLQWMRNILIFILPVATVFCCVVLAFYASSDPLKELNDSWLMALTFVQDGTVKLISAFETVGQLFAEHIGGVGVQKCTEFIDRVANLDFARMASETFGGVCELLHELWSFVGQSWNRIVAGITALFKWIQSLLS